MTLFNALILSRLDYCSRLWSPHLIRHIIQIEKVQRSFTKCITGMRDCSYSGRLSLLRLYSLQRRRERYCIIYVWKIIEDLVPNFSKPIVCTHSERRGRYCVVSHVNIGRSGTLAYNSFRWRAIRLFNSLPKFMRCTTSCSVNGFQHTKASPFHALIDLGENDCPYWLVVWPICQNFMLCFLLVPIGGIRLCISLELVTSEKSGKLAQNKTR